MESLGINQITHEYKERIARLALLDPLYELERKTRTDQGGKAIDMYGFGLLTLLFFFEQMLMRNRRSGVRELSLFLQETSNSVYDLSQEEYESIARIIIHTFRPTSGKKRERSFFNWETKQSDQFQYSILKAADFNVKTNNQYYTLDEDGLELVFATKEYYSEFQLSIHQLVLRKQLEKGEFGGALRQINEMRIDVESLRQRITMIQHEIQRNIVSEETYEKFKRTIEDVYSRLKREDEEFKELEQFVKETKDRLYYKQNEKKEMKAYELILQISKELEEVHHEHGLLFQESIEMKTKALQAAQESLYYVGIDSFNFNQEITAKIVSTPLPLEATRGIVAPFLPIHHEKTWSPLTVFEEQRIDNEEETPESGSFLTLDDETVEKQTQQTQRQNFAEMMKIVMEALEDRNEIELSEVVEMMKQSGREALLSHRSFYEFWIIIHQRSPLNDETDRGKQGHVLDDVLILLNNRVLSVFEKKQIVKVTERYSLQNMLLRLEESLNEL
jgi:hypothetical protein